MEQLYRLFKQTSGIATDTRAIHKDSFFIALKGDNFNGNTFVQKAIDQGAKFAITDEKERADNESIFYVPNTLLFLQDLARHHRRQFTIPIIGITGSNGKTTTKELTRDVLKTQFNVLATKGNLNNHIGVPLTLLELNQSHEIAVIEMGANKPGDIKELVEIAEPNSGIITNIGKAHLEGFGDFNGVYNTKKELFDFISKNIDPFFINEDYKEFEQLLKYEHTISIGTLENDFYGELINLSPFVNYKWFWKEKEYTVQTKIIGSYNFYNLLCATRIGLHYGIEPKNINAALSNYTPDNNRSQIVKTERNTVIMDAYNANPSSMTSALESFRQMEGKNKWVLLGDMLELGSESLTEHQAIFDLVSKLGLNAIYIGTEFGKITTEKKHYSNAIDAISDLEQISNGLILVKGSRGIKLESITEHL
jgi:UDP-N-acetylmuramoyl-tripeptide--D-alanyl-D-alanine ligase